MADEFRDYFVVEFPEEAIEGSLPLAVVPSVWVSVKKKICYWPDFRHDQERKKAVIGKTCFQSSLCKACPINIKYKTNSYEKALQKMKSLEKYDATSASSQSEEELAKRKSKPNSLFREFDCPNDSLKNSNSFQSSSTTTNIDSDSSEEMCPAIPLLTSSTINDKFEDLCDISDDERTLLPKQIEDTRKEPIVTLQKVCGETRALLENVNRQVELLAGDVKFIMQMVQRNSIVETLENVQPMNFPLNSEAEIKEFNAKLAENDDFFKDACASLLCVGGKDVNDSMRRILAKVVSHNLSLEYNWSGRRGKKSFAELKNINRLFLVCLRKNPLTKNATESEMATVIKTWLRTAGDRMGGRSRRKNKCEGE